MKPVKEIMEGVREICPDGVFPGRDGVQVADWEVDPFHVLISTVLSQRTKDQNTFHASARLFAEYDTPATLAAAPLRHLQDLIRPAGFPQVKARAIKEIARIIVEEKGGEVPSDLDELVSLPMVGRKTANCVRSYAFHIPSICVDTHVHRISNRIGLVRTKDPEGTEMELMSIVPKELWIDVNSLLVRFGQKICLPRNPRCGLCPLTSWCDYHAQLQKGRPMIRLGRKRPKE